MNSELLFESLSLIDPAYLDEAEQYRPKTPILRPLWRRFALAAACIALCLCSAVPALAAADFAPAYEMLYRIAPGAAQTLKPVNVSCTREGIELQVLAAGTDGAHAEILLSLTGDAIDETTDLFDSADLHAPVDQSCTCSLQEYDPDTNTAVFLLSVEAWGADLRLGDKLTFSLSRILCGKAHTEIELPIDLTQVPQAQAFLSDPVLRGRSSLSGEAPDTAHLLVPTRSVPLAPGVTLTGYGLAEDVLHIQLRYADILNTDNHGSLYWRDGKGDATPIAETVSFWAEDSGDSYEEYLLPCSLLDEEGSLWGDFLTCSSGAIEGDWSVTFPLSAIE